MRIVKPSCEIWEQRAGLEGVYKQIEKVGRVCYKSEDKITEDSAKPFVDRMIKSGHGAMLEHGTVYLQYETVKSAINPLTKYYLNKYSKVKAKEGVIGETTRLFVTTNTYFIWKYYTFRIFIATIFIYNLTKTRIVVIYI